MEGYLRLILLGIAIVIVVFIALEAWFSRRRQYKLANLTENFISPIQIDSDDALGLDPHEPKIGAHDFADEERDYFLAEKMTQEKSSYAHTFTESEEDVMVATRPARTATTDYSNDLLVLSVVAKPGQQFGSYDLLQSIYATGMEFGNMNIFHYHAPDKFTKEALFSLASATEPGDFDLDRIGNYFCSGLTLFTQLESVPDAQEAFNLMLRAAEQLAEDLNGELRAGPHKTWTLEMHQEYQQKVMYFQLKKRA
jgi:cell division protein ZipA